MTNKLPATLTTEQAATRLNTTPRNVRNHCRAKNIEGAQLIPNESTGRMEWRIPSLSLEKFAKDYDPKPGRKRARGGG